MTPPTSRSTRILGATTLIQHRHTTTSMARGGVGPCYLENPPTTTPQTAKATLGPQRVGTPTTLTPALTGKP